jgi:hypothetical protein
LSCRLDQLEKLPSAVELQLLEPGLGAPYAILRHLRISYRSRVLRRTWAFEITYAPYFCGSHATAPQIRFTPRDYILNLLAVGMKNLWCNGKGAPYFGRVEFERGLWRSALSRRAKWRRHALLSDGQSNPQKRWRKADSVQAFTNRFDRQYLVAIMVIHSRNANP